MFETNFTLSNFLHLSGNAKIIPLSIGVNHSIYIVEQNGIPCLSVNTNQEKNIFAPINSNDFGDLLSKLPDTLDKLAGITMLHN
jgi:hypothetical protein